MRTEVSNRCNCDAIFGNNSFMILNPSSLFEWQSPRTFASALASLHDVPSERLFNEPTLNRLHREVWAASKFCELSSARKIKVRLTRSDSKSSDFEILLRDGKQVRLQFVEADFPNRRRGAEYRVRAKQQDRFEKDPFENWVARRRAIPAALHKCIALKSKKGYPPDIGLLIYLNLGTYGEWSAEIEREMVDPASEFGKNFHSVWVIWHGRLYRTWPNPGVGQIGPMFSTANVRLGEWRERHNSIRALNDLFSN